MTTPQVTCESRIVKVDVYARGAVVTRDVTLPDALPADEVEVLVPGIPLQAEPGSLQAAVNGDREIIGLTSTLHLLRATANPAELERQIKELERERQQLALRRSELAQERQSLAQLQAQPHQKPRQRRRNLGWLDDAAALTRLGVDLLAQTDEALIALDEQLREVDRRRAAAELALRQARAAQTVDPDQATRQLVLRLGPGKAGRLQGVTLSYVVGAARWWPAYTARLTQGGTRAEWSIEAFVAQKTDEDWQGVALTLCTADLTRDVQLPELRSLRIGRAQKPRPSGYRPPPEGLDALFADYDRAFASPPPPAQPAPPPSTTTFAGGDGAYLAEQAIEAEDMDEETYFKADLKTTGSFAPPPPVMAPGAPMPSAAPAPYRGGPPMGAGGGMPMPQAQSARRAAPVPEAKKAKGRLLRAEAAYDMPMSEAVPPAEAPMPAEIEPDEGWLDFDQLSMGSGESRAVRGRLQPQRSSAGAQRRQSAIQAIGVMPAPRLTSDPLQTRGLFDHRYPADGRIDLPGDGHAHRVGVTRASATCRTDFRAIPRVEEKVYREVKLDNPFGSPLLAGPVDVFVDGALVITSSIDTVDRGGSILFGLGVEERLRVSRNTSVQESALGLFKGTTAIVHEVEFEVASALGFQAPITVVDRIPTTTDDDIEIELLDAEPGPEPWDQRERGNPIKGGLRWTLLLDPGARTTIRFRYQVKFPAKYELNGGNRRE